MAHRYYDRDDRDRAGEYNRDERDTPRGRDIRSGRGGRDVFDRAGDEVRSWFGDDEAASRREMDERRDRQRGYERGEYAGWREHRDDDWRSRGGDWRDRADEWSNRDRVGSSGPYTGRMDSREWSQRERGRDEGLRGGYFTSDRGEWRTSGRGRDAGDDDRSWLGGGPHWGREYGWGPEARERGMGSGEAERHGRFSGRGPRGYQRSDERIREDVCDRLTMHGDVDASNIEVDVVGSEVTLRGTVDSRSSRRLAEDIAESVHGVRHVHNEIRVGQADAAGTGGASGGMNAGAGGVAGAAAADTRQRERVR